MKKIIAIILATTMMLAMMAVSVSAKTYYVSDWAEDANDALELTWSEDPTRNVEKGEFMFSFLRMIQASHMRNGDDILESNQDLDFKDADELDYDEQEEASILVDLGVLNGYKGYMNLDNDVTRAESAKILYYFNDELDLDTVRSNPKFTDIADHWAETYINYAFRIKMVNGKSNSIYDPEGNLTIEEMVQIMYNISKVADFTEEDIAFALVNTFDVETDLDVDEYTVDSNNSVLYLNVDDTVTYTSKETSYWYSSKPSIASVTSKGKITARNEGTATITNGDDMVITVIVGDTERYVSIGDEVDISTYTTTAWRSSNSRVATVDKYAVVTGLKEGTVTIYRGDDESYKVNVVEDTVIEMKADETVKLGNTFANWKSSNTKVATVSSKGTVTAVGTGTATISSKYASYMIIVSPTSNLKMNIGDTVLMEGVKWTSSNAKIVSILSNGTIKALKNGTVTLTSDNTTMTVTVGNNSSDYTRCYTLYVGDTKTLGNGKYDASWESDNTRIATVSNYGKVTAKKIGETVIYNDDDEYLITVIDEDDETEYDITLIVGEKVLVGSGKYDSSWESENSRIASVDEYGFVTAKKAGETAIYNDDDEYYITVVEDDDDNNDSGNGDYDYNKTIVYVEGFEPSTYYNAWVDDTIKIVVESENGELEDVNLSNSKCKLTKTITSLGSDKYTFTVNSVSAGACIITLEFEDGETIEFTINSYKE